MDGLKVSTMEVRFRPPRHLTGYALTDFLETNPEFIALLAAVKGGDEELPAYLRMRTAGKGLPSS